MRQALADYLTQARHVEAERLMARAERTFHRLSKDFDDHDERTLRAYEIAGVDLADVRSLRTSYEERAALAKLKASVRGADVITRIRVISAVACANLPRPANR